ncbi:MAG: hypothetical protein JXA57_15095, partial [Armatimonadetes bacterium]|nr:hypothetical protein [Armatimonadota bacterium]
FLQRLHEVPEPDGILLVCRTVPMSRLVERRAGGFRGPEEPRFSLRYPIDACLIPGGVQIRTGIARDLLRVGPISPIT